jgi:hypothetical protein
MIVRIFDADPTRTQYLRNKFEKDLVARFSRLKTLIRDALKSVRFNDEKINPDRFLFRTKGEKVEEFMSWLRDNEAELGLRITRKTTGVSAVTNKVWADVYIDTAYKQGLRRARQELNKGKTRVDGSQMAIDMAFNSPVHAERVGMIYSRAYSDLDGITDEMDKQISRTLAQGIIEGKGTEQIKNDLIDRVDKIGINRARMLARTEIVAAHHAANMIEYRAYGIKGVSVLAEVLVSGNNTCDECYAEQEKGPRPLDEVETLIPIHVNCACVVTPFLED